MWYINSTQQEHTHFELESVMTKNIVLFDMDGTLTEARRPFAEFLSSPLKALGHVAEVGIVTGSDLDYVKEQMSDLIDDPSFRYRLHILPCNGTKWLTPPEFPSHDHDQIHAVSMKKEIGKDKYHKLIEILLNLQNEAAEFDIPLTGNFIAARGSMINWCPIGRAADNSERKQFKNFDKKYNLRKNFFMKLRILLDSNEMQNVTIKLGGDTSFDIYPTGWDKTYALRHFSGKNVWFVGDRALSPKGNDWEIFQACGARSFHTKNPKQTKEVIEQITKTIREETNGLNRHVE
jgi:phosphomannomutase